MLKSCPGSIDGIHVKNFREGVEYDIPESLAKCFFESKSATECSDEQVIVEQPKSKQQDIKVVETKKDDIKSSTDTTEG